MGWLLTFTGLIFLLSFVIPGKLQSQCYAEAGENVAICTFWGTDTVYLGGSPSTTGGTPPYTYFWTCNYSDEWFTYTAGNFLDDVTIANPRIVDWVSIDVPLKFYLTVTDSEGLSCTDSVIVQFSIFIITLDVKHAHIHQGDSVQLYTSVHGGIPPIAYQWTPVTGLTDPTDVYTYAKPESTTTYNLMVTDSGGCQVSDDFYVFVVPTSTQWIPMESISIDLSPNPLIDISTFNFTGSVIHEQPELHIYDLLGRLKMIIPIKSERTNIHSSDFEPGFYIYHLLHKNKILKQGRFIVQ